MPRTYAHSASPVVVLSTFLAIASFTGCGDSGTIARSEASKLKTGIAQDLGEAMSQQIADAWVPVLAAAAQRDAAAAAQDFAALHVALLRMAAEYGRAVDATIRLLDTAPDQSWRRRMFTDAAMGGSGSADKGTAKSLREQFPSPAASEKFDWTVVAVEPWFRRQSLEHPREAGELARALVGLQADAARLQMFFVEAIGSQAMKAMGEAYDGFKNGGKPPASDATSR
jgi:hypothetical protein